MKGSSCALWNLANMDQTPLLLVLEDNKTYNTKGADEIQCLSGQSGLDKHQWTVRLSNTWDEKILISVSYAIF